MSHRQDAADPLAGFGGELDSCYPVSCPAAGHDDTQHVNLLFVASAPAAQEEIQATAFYPAEEYHQDYLVKSPGGYTCHYLRD